MYFMMYPPGGAAQLSAVPSGVGLVSRPEAPEGAGLLSRGWPPGLERRVTAHSGRVGLASELTSRGASTTDVMLAGNWKTSRLVTHYSAGATAERGAVARYL